MTPIVLPWLVEIALITWRSMTGTHFQIMAGQQNIDPATGKPMGPKLPGKVFGAVQGVKRPPLPSELLATFVAFGAYAAIAEKNAQIGRLLAWGTVLATGLLMFSQGASTGQQPEQLNSRQSQNYLTQAGAAGAATPQYPRSPYGLYYPYPQGLTGQGGY